jgi:carboxypeptidase Taq
MQAGSISGLYLLGGVMKRIEVIERLEELDRHLVMLEHIESVLSWDQEIAASKKGLDERAKQMGWLSSEAHELACGNEMGDILSHLGADNDNPEGDGNDDFEKALIRIRYRVWEKERSLPVSLVRKLSEATSIAHESWVEARKQDDWNLFKPELETLVELTREKAACYAKEGSTQYDVLLDDYEQGMKTSTVKALFDSVKPALVSLVKKQADCNVDNSFLFQEYPIDKQEGFAFQVLSDMGFDFTRGSRAVSVHPFTSTLGSDDIRITTRYTDPSVMDSFYSSVHEGGHALYEMGASKGRQKGTSIANGASMGMHESQSRLWENMIGRSEAFWIHYFPLFKKTFPSQLEGVGFEQFVKAINRVEPGYIRTNADEVSYSLHVILRFELEQSMLDGSLSLEDVPQAWNRKSEELLGIVPPTCRQGALQDVHWSGADFGYFPTYALGNLYGAQFWEKLNSDIDSEALLKAGNLKAFGSYLDKEIYGKGSLYKPMDLLFGVTGKRLDANLFTKYLDNKFCRLFG